MGKSVAHRMVAETAKGMAGELYETMMRDNVWYAVWKRQNPGASVKALESRFIAKNTRQLLPTARATLASMLADPSIPDLMKREIYDALVLDRSLIIGRPDMAPAEVVLKKEDC